jgi:DNA-directed RNA polymerase specialized sigma24 family protein
MDGMTPDFHTTRWSMVAAAGRSDATGAPEALSELCETYWYPLYAYARRRGLMFEVAEDRTQGFFAALLEKGWVRAADPERGRFRAFLLTAFKRHLNRERQREAAAKRGGGRTHLRLDFDDGERRFLMEPADDMTPERLFDRRWALVLLARTLDDLAGSEADSGRGPQFEQLRAFLPGADRSLTHREAAERLDMTQGAVKTAVHRLRRRYHDRLRAEIAHTVATESEIDAEIADLLAALSR